MCVMRDATAAHALPFMFKRPEIVLAVRVVVRREVFEQFDFLADGGLIALRQSTDALRLKHAPR
jgi:hypothetical protein